MPLAKYYGGKGASVMKQMKSEYGAKKGERVFYATANTMKNKPCKTCMGRKVEYHSPAKHPEQGDPYAEMDKQIEEYTTKGAGSYEQMRKEMKPMQQESPKPAKKMQEGLDYLQRLYRGK